MDRMQMSRVEIKEKFLRDHRRLRAKAAVVTTLALSVLRGDEDLASALRLKGEEMYAYLLEHMEWEETQLIPLLAESSIGETIGSAILERHEAHRQRLSDSLADLRKPGASFVKLARDCVALVRRLEDDMASEEREVFKSIDIGA
ncbi:MAG: hemerythrin domain-containing protein [Deltaproteobacteria bacterium]|nr:hemerythrin domain-containing protein [Deltaproteobacteria bacterium]